MLLRKAERMYWSLFPPKTQPSDSTFPPDNYSWQVVQQDIIWYVHRNQLGPYFFSKFVQLGGRPALSALHSCGDTWSRLFHFIPFQDFHWLLRSYTPTYSNRDGQKKYDTVHRKIQSYLYFYRKIRFCIFCRCIFPTMYTYPATIGRSTSTGGFLGIFQIM